LFKFSSLDSIFAQLDTLRASNSASPQLQKKANSQIFLFLFVSLFSIPKNFYGTPIVRKPQLGLELGLGFRSEPPPQKWGKKKNQDRPSRPKKGKLFHEFLMCAQRRTLSLSIISLNRKPQENMVSVNQTVGIGDSGRGQTGINVRILITRQRRKLALCSVLSTFTAKTRLSFLGPTMKTFYRIKSLMGGFYGN